MLFSIVAGMLQVSSEDLGSALTSDVQCFKGTTFSLHVCDISVSINTQAKHCQLKTGPLSSHRLINEGSLKRSALDRVTGEPNLTQLDNCLLIQNIQT